VYQYWGFELNILSEIEFPELLPSEFEQADIVIRYGPIPGDADQPGGDEKLHERIISSAEYFLDIKNICKYYVSEGKELVVAPYDGVGGRVVRIYLLATVMAVVLLQRGSMPLHASGILKDDQLILFTGDSGAGKSTTLAYLVSKGYLIFTDDVCVLKTDPGNDRQVLGVSSYPMLKLWDDAISKLDDDAYRNKTFRINNEQDKYGYFFYDTFIKESFPIKIIFIIKKNDGIDSVSVRKLSGIEAFQELEKQAYRKYLITDNELRALHFKTMSLLTQNCTVFEVCRPVNGTVEALAAAITARF
jgi:hypothetical protein